MTHHYYREDTRMSPFDGNDPKLQSTFTPETSPRRSDRWFAALGEYGCWSEGVKRTGK